MRRSVLLPAAIVVLTLLCPSAGAAGCAVTVDPEQGWPGASLHVTGTGFEPGADITVYLGEYPMYDGFIDEQGRFAIELQVPAPFDTGDVGVTVTDHTDYCGVVMSYVIGEPPPPPRETSISGWQLALLVAIGAAFGFGVAGLAMHRRSSG